MWTMSTQPALKGESNLSRTDLLFTPGFALALASSVSNSLLFSLNLTGCSHEL